MVPHYATAELIVEIKRRLGDAHHKAKVILENSWLVGVLKLKTWR
jgi:hypothetical protein